MKNLFLNFCLLIGLCLLFTCNSNTPSEEEEKGKDRNMFGLHIPRGLTKSTEGLEPGYAMFAVPNSSLIYLVNRKGEVVHQWKGNYGVMGAYLQDDGSLFQTASDPDFPTFAGGGQMGRIQRINWDSKIEWDFEYATEDYHVHHDFAVMPNGHILAISWEAKTYEEAIQAGRKPEIIPKAGIWPDKIIEVIPDGKYGGEVVWEWHAWDHMIQDFDSEKDNYGDPAAHPELFDINVSEPLPEPISQDSMDRLHEMGRVRRNITINNRGADMYHFNAINYNEELDQIALSSPHLSEIFIIDHSTTTQEAAGHSGGRSGKGGDLLFRWGNPENYHQGDSSDQQLFGQHDVRWIEKEKPGAEHLTVYNNDIPGGPDSMSYSAIYELELSRDESGNYVMENNRFLPEKAFWKYVAEDTVSFWGSFISGAHRMKNGNTFINEGPRGRIFEVTPEGEIVWEYLREHRGTIHKPNGDPNEPIPFAYFGFRATFIPMDHPGLEGRELKPLDPQPEVFKLPPPKKGK